MSQTKDNGRRVQVSGGGIGGRAANVLNALDALGTPIAQRRQRRWVGRRTHAVAHLKCRAHGISDLRVVDGPAFAAAVSTPTDITTIATAEHIAHRFP